MKEKWEDWNNNITETLIANKLREAESPKAVYDIMYFSIIDASHTLFAPSRIAAPREKPKPWWTPQCKKATSAARRAYNKWRTSLLKSDKTEFKKLEVIKKKTIIKAKNDAWNKYIDSLDQPGNITTFWNFSKSILKEKKTQHS